MNLSPRNKLKLFEKYDQPSVDHINMKKKKEKSFMHASKVSKTFFFLVIISLMLQNNDSEGERSHGY